MRILLLWRRTGGNPVNLDAGRVAQRLEQMFSSLVRTPPQTTIREHPAATMALLQAPVQGWKPPFFEGNEQTWALAVEYPVDAHAVLAANGVRAARNQPLLTLCRSLQDDPTPLLREMAPPFSLIWFSRETEEVFIQNDGLGAAQLFEYQDSTLWALTNKIFALRALDVSLEPQPEEWAVKATLDWFPCDMTGYKRTRFLGPGTQVRLDSERIRRTTHDVLREWVNPGGLPHDQCLEMARGSVLKQIKAAMALWVKPSADLTGGWDTRAVVALLRHLGVEFSARVRGRLPHHDVVIATSLAKIAGFDLEVLESAALPPDSAGDCKRAITLALLWQAGHMMNRQHKEFRPDGGLPEGRVKIMGQHGEIGRGTHAKRIQAIELNLNEEQCEEHLVSYWMKKIPPFTRDIYHDRVREIIREAYRQADRYGLTGLARLDFLSLYEGHRRWASAKLNLFPGVNFAPFLTPGYIRAVYSYPGQRKDTNPFHQHIIATHAPDWVSVPYGSDPQMSRVLDRHVNSSSEETLSLSSWRQPTGTSHYDNVLYWNQVGAPIIHEALDQCGFWAEVFDWSVAETEWQAAPDSLAMLHLLPTILEVTGFW